MPSSACSAIARCLQQAALGGAPARRLVVGLDVNGTILEGDSFHGDLGDATLTPPANELLSELERRHGSARIVLYTFGSDAGVVKEQIVRRPGGRWSFPPDNHFFIARGSGGGDGDDGSKDEIWAFAMSPAAGAEAAATSFVDYTSFKDPHILLERPSAVPLLTTAAQLDTASPPLRFGSAGAFGAFVHRLLDRGDVLFRAAYDPGHAYFRKRSDAGSRCKVLCCAHSSACNNTTTSDTAATSAEVVAFDDNDDDWEVLSSASGVDDSGGARRRRQHTVVHALTPGLAARLNAGGGAEADKVARRHAAALVGGTYVPTDMVGELRAAMLEHGSG
eukprot:414613-Prymnesium_polylepis.1